MRVMQLNNENRTRNIHPVYTAFVTECWGYCEN